MRTSLLFFFGTVALAALSWALYASGWLRGPHTSDSLISMIGIFISAFSFLFAGYFAVIAVTAYAHIRDIERMSSDAKRLHHEAQQEFVELRAMIDDAKGRGSNFLKYLAAVGSVVSEFMNAVDQQSGERVRELHLAIKRYQFFDSPDDRERFNAARELVALGDREDLEVVEKYLVMSKSADARGLLRTLRARLHEEFPDTNGKAA